MRSLTLVDLLDTNEESVDVFGYFYSSLNNNIFRYANVDYFILEDSVNNRYVLNHEGMSNTFRNYNIKGLVKGKFAYRYSEKYIKLMKMIKYKSHSRSFESKHSDFIMVYNDNYTLKSITGYYTTIPFLLVDYIFGNKFSGVTFDGNTLTVNIKIKQDEYWTYIYEVDAVKLAKFITLKG